VCQRRAANPRMSPVVPVTMAWANGDMTPLRKNTTDGSAPGVPDSATARPKYRCSP
jgi:hypothetical protein